MASRRKSGAPDGSRSATSLPRPDNGRETERLAYLAGLFDGDGSVMHVAGWRMMLTVTVNDSDSAREMLDLYRARFGGGVGSTATDRLKAGWRCTTGDADGAFRAMLPYLYIKRSKGILALALQHAHQVNLPVDQLPYTRAAMDDSRRRHMPPDPQLMQAALIELEAGTDPVLAGLVELYRAGRPAMTAEQAIAWCAGVFDAEGHITLCANDTDREFWKWTLGWSQAQSPEADAMLTAIAGVFGGNRVNTAGSCSPCWQLLLGQRDMFAALCGMYPHLTLKREQARWAIRLLAVGRVTDHRLDVRGDAFNRVSRLLRLLKDATHQKPQGRADALRQLPAARAAAEQALAAVGAPNIDTVLTAQRNGTVLRDDSTPREQVGPFTLRDDRVHLNLAPAFRTRGCMKEKLLGELIRRPGGASAALLRTAAWDDPDKVRRTARLRVHIYQLRQRLAPHGIAITTLGNWGFQLIDTAA